MSQKLCRLCGSTAPAVRLFRCAAYEDSHHIHIVMELCTGEAATSAQHCICGFCLAVSTDYA
jgi:hypothetical protein